jgi:cyclophilin family peptidyl-prolyl cis-trans isomerase
MPRPTRQDREDARRRAQTAAEQRHRASLRKKRIVAVVVAVMLVLSTVAGVIAATVGSSDESASPTVPATAPGATAPAPPATGVAPLPAERGATLTGATPCPAADGSSPRTTQFAEPPPLCIDTSRFHTAVVTTDVGPLTFQLNPRRAPASVNAFVVLARYGYYDGQPVTLIRPRGWFEAGGQFTPEGPSGFAVPDEVPPQGQIFTPGTIAMRGVPGAPGTNRGEFLVATYDDAPAIDPGVSAFGIMLDGSATLAAIDGAASQDGLPTRPITIQSITVTESGAIG